MGKKIVFNNRKPRGYDLNIKPNPNHAPFETPSYAFKSRDELDVTILALQTYLNLCNHGTYHDVGEGDDKTAVVSRVLKRLSSM